MCNLFIDDTVVSTEKSMAYTNAILSKDMKKYINRKGIKEQPFFEKENIFIYIFFKFFLRKKSRNEQIEMIYKNICTYLNEGYYICIGEEWEDSVMVYGYKGRVLRYVTGELDGVEYSLRRKEADLFSIIGDKEILRLHMFRENRNLFWKNPIKRFHYSSRKR